MAGRSSCPKPGSPTAIPGNSSGAKAPIGSASAAKWWPTASGVAWHPAEEVEATAVDTPVVGWRGKRVNTLRLWTAARSIRSSSMPSTPAITSGRWPNRCAPTVWCGCSIRRIRALPGRNCGCGRSISSPPPRSRTSSAATSSIMAMCAPCPTRRRSSSTIPIRRSPWRKSMRLLVDVHGLEFDEAWEITRRTMGYTNHTLLPEALESWPLPLFERLLPRHMQIIYAINSRVLREARKAGMDAEAISAISLIDERRRRRVRMANLAFAGAHSVNGVAALHTELMKTTVFSDLHRLYPGKINNKTNGVTPRRWLQQCNPGLTSIIKRCHRRCFPRRCGEAGRRWTSWLTMPRWASGRRGEAQQQGRAGRSPQATSPASGSIPMRCSMSRSSASMNTSASCSIWSKRSRSMTRSAAIPSATGCRGSRSSAARRRRAITTPS